MHEAAAAGPGAGAMAAGGAAAGLVGAAASYGFGELAATAAQGRWRQSLKKGPSLMAEGLERAGINRIIAAGGGIHSGSAGSMAKAMQPNVKLDNPSISVGQRGLLAAQTNAATSAGSLTRLQEEIRSKELPRAQALADYYSTPPGKATAVMGEVNKALPTTMTGAGIRGAAGAAELFRRFTTPMDPNQRDIVPRENRR